MMDNENNNDVYRDDNSFNNQGIENSESNGQIPRSGGNSVTNFGKGVGKGIKSAIDHSRNNPALGVKGTSNKDDPMKGQRKPDKKREKMPGDKGNSAKRQDENKKKGNPLPGIDNKKNDNNKRGSQNKENNNDKNKGFGSKLNPLSRGGGLASRLGLGSKKGSEGKGKDSKGVIAPNLTEIPQKGIKAVWTMAPIQVKVAIVMTSIIPILILVGILLLAIFGATTAAITASMCGSDGSSSSGSSYSGSGYTGSGDAKEFMCKMQQPILPSYYRVSSEFGPRGGRLHGGIDLSTKRVEGRDVYATQAGTVTIAKPSGTYGNLVEIKHNDKLVTRYAHNSKILVKVGDKVGKGQLIAKSGNTGRSTGPHLHYEVRYNNTPQNPNDYFKNHETFKKNCGSMWDGEFAGDSANAANDTSEYESSGSDVSNTECCDTSSSSSSTSSSGNYCPNGITVKGVGTLSIDDYVAGVVSAENSYKDSKNPDNIETMKAQAIAARTYAVNSTKNCTKEIGNSQSSQVYKDANERAKKASSETAGAVMTYKGDVFSAQYDAFCMNDKDCPDAVCSGTICTSTYTKVPSNETHKITVKLPHSKNVYSGGYNGAGHARGMSQLVARQMQDEGKKFDEILRFFYADGIEINGVSNTCTLGQASFNGKIWYYDQTDYKEPYGSFGTIATHGCGPTAMAIVVSSLLNAEHNPVELTKYACSNGYCTSGGTKHDFFAAAAKKYGLTIKQVSRENSDEVLAALSGGKSIIIAIMGPGTFTSDGHFITLTGSDGNQVFVHDPNNGDGKKFNKLWDFDLIKRETSKGTNTPFWIVSK